MILADALIVKRCSYLFVRDIPIRKVVTNWIIDTSIIGVPKRLWKGPHNWIDYFIQLESKTIIKRII